MSDTNTQTPLQNTTKEKIEELKRAFNYFYDENLTNVYKAKDYTDPITHNYYKSSTDLIDELWALGVPKNTPLKTIELLLEQRYETLTKVSDSTDTNSMTPDSGTREVQEQERQSRVDETLKSQEKAKLDQAIFEERLLKSKARIWPRATKDLDQIKITQKNKEFIYGMAQAAKLDPGTTQEHVEKLIRSSIPESEIEDYPESLIKNRAANFVLTVQNFSVYNSPNEIPDKFTVTPVYSPLTSLINPKDQTLVDKFTDNFVRDNISEDAQKTILVLSTQRDVDEEIFEPSVFGGDNNLTQVFFGGDEIVQFTPDGNEGDGVAISTDDLLSLHKNSQEITKFFQKYIEIDSGGAEVVSTGFIPLRAPLTELESVDTSKVIGKKSILGGIEGAETQGELARRIAREKAKLIAKVESFMPSADPQIVNQTKSILGKISGEIVPQTIIKNTALTPVRLGISIGDGVRPVTLELSGNFGGSTESFLKLMRDTNTPLIITSFADGAYATSDLAITQAIASQFNGKVLAYLGAGKYSFSVVNAGNTMLGGQALSLHQIRLQLGKKFVEVGFSQTAGKITGATLARGVGTGVIKKTALPAIVSKIANLLGIAGGWATFGLTTVIGLGLGKFIEWIGPKIKKLISENKEVIFGGGALLFLLLPGTVPRMIGATAMLAGGAAAVAGGGFLLANAVRTTRNLMSAIFFVTFGEIWKPILIFLLTTPLVIAFILFIINSGAYIVPPNPLSGPGMFSSPYIDVRKSADPPGPFKNSELPKTITYKVTINAKKGPLTNIKITDKCEVISKTKSTCPTYSIPTLPSEISPTSGYSFDYTMAFDPTFADAAIINTIIVTADEPSQPGATASISNSVTIGTPPISCPLIGGHVATPNLNYSFNGSNNTGHGSNAYWSAMGLDHTYSLPQSTSCRYPGDCSYYGYAYDIFPATSTDVFAPTVLGKETSWICSYAFSNGGGAAGYTYHCQSGDGNYLLVLTHMSKNTKEGTLNPGDKIGTLFNQGANTHLHIEFMANGRYVKPETYFCGGK